MTDIVCAAQMKDLIGEKSNTRMDGHLKDVRITQWKLFDIIKGITSKVEPVPEKPSRFHQIRNCCLRSNRILRR